MNLENQNTNENISEKELIDDTNKNLEELGYQLDDKEIESIEKDDQDKISKIKKLLKEMGNDF